MKFYTAHKLPIWIDKLPSVLLEYSYAYFMAHTQVETKRV